MRDKRKSLELNIDSALALMQEIYNDVVEQKNTASLITKKMLVFMKEAADMSMIGPVIKEQQKILQDCTDKKIALVKLQAALFKKTNGGNTDKPDFGKLQLSSEDRELLQKMIDEKDDESKNESNNDDGKYNT